jgi:UDP-N-acetylmuramoyl-L-alanyl-D-glutamate--2,6-diaminopimelate ligase
VESSWGAGTLRSRLMGEFNAENLLAVLGVLLGWQVPLQQALVALAACGAPPGRMEAFGGGAQPLALVDYAHSPDARQDPRANARTPAGSCSACSAAAGTRPGKRIMGAVAEAQADVVATDDNRAASRRARSSSRSWPACAISAARVSATARRRSLRPDRGRPR